MFNDPVSKTFDVSYPDHGRKIIDVGEAVARDLYARMKVTERRIIGGHTVLIGRDSCGARVSMRLPFRVIESDLAA